MGEGRRETVKKALEHCVLCIKETQGKECTVEPLKLNHCANVLFSPSVIIAVGAVHSYAIVCIWCAFCSSTQNSLIVGGADDARLMCLI